jgi:hypothetical protein
MTEQNFLVKVPVTFRASHRLLDRPIHEHSFNVLFVFSGSREEFDVGYHQTMLINFFSVRLLWRTRILPTLVNADNEIGIAEPSLENICCYLFTEMDRLTKEEGWPSLFSTQVCDGDGCVEIQRND